MKLHIACFPFCQLLYYLVICFCGHSLTLFFGNFFIPLTIVAFGIFLGYFAANHGAKRPTHPGMHSSKDGMYYEHAAANNEGKGMSEETPLEDAWGYNALSKAHDSSGNEKDYTTNNGNKLPNFLPSIYMSLGWHLTLFPTKLIINCCFYPANIIPCPGKGFLYIGQAAFGVGDEI